MKARRRRALWYRPRVRARGRQPLTLRLRSCGSVGPCAATQSVKTGDHSIVGRRLARQRKRRFERAAALALAGDAIPRER